MFSCIECHKLFQSIPDLINHIRSNCVLSNNCSGARRYRCGQDGCFRFYSCINSFRKHLQREHFADSHIVSDSLSSMEPLTQSFLQTDSVSDVDARAHMFILVENSMEALVSSLYSNPTIPRNAIQSFMVILEQFMESYASHVSNCINLVMRSRFSPTQIEESLQSICLASIKKMAEFNTEYKRLKHFEEKGTYIPSLEIQFATRNEVRANKFCCVPVTQQIVPIGKVLKKMLSFDHVFRDITDYCETLSKFSEPVVNIVQGTVWKSKNYVSTMNVLHFPLILYFDDFEVNNPLGSHTSIQKLSGLYLSLPFLPPKMVSQLNNILILSVFHATDRTTYGNKLLFQSIIDQLNSLSSHGVEVNNSHFQGIIKFHVICLVGDNLGLNGILGFVESFSANYCCRICRVNKKELQEIYFERESLMRTRESYETDLQLADPSKTGIKENCAWLELDGFSLFENVAVDTLHDYLEGCCRYVMSSLIKYLVQGAKFISFTILKSKIESFNYGHDSSSKPCNALTLDSSSIVVKTSGSEMFTLVRYFSLIAGFYVPREDKIWETYLLMRKLLDKLFLRRYYCSDVEQLEVLIEHFLDSYKKNFKSTLKPKFHFLVHYGNMIRKFGPLYQISSMRFEAKHKVSKVAARAAISRVNICKTVLIRNQLSLNRLFLQGYSFDYLKFGLRTKVSPEISTILRSHFNIDSTYFSIKYFVKEGIRIQTSDIITWDLCLDTGDPRLAHIDAIYVDNAQNMFLKCSHLKCLGFDYHYHAFEVENYGEEPFFITLSDLYSLVPNNLTILPDGTSYVTLRDQNF